MDDFVMHRKHNKKTVTIRLAPVHLDRIQAIADAVYGGNLSAATRDVVTVGLEHYARARDRRNSAAA